MVVEVTLPVGPTGIEFLGNPPFVDSVDKQSPLAATVKFGMYFVSLYIPTSEDTFNDLSLVELNERIRATADVKGRTLVLTTKKPKSQPSRRPVQVAKPAPVITKHIILKKAWKNTDDKSLSFHGVSMTEPLANHVKSFVTLAFRGPRALHSPGSGSPMVSIRRL